MSTVLVIGVAVGLWLVVFFVLIGACRSAQRGDEALLSEGPATIEEPVADPTPRRVQAPR